MSVVGYVMAVVSGAMYFAWGVDLYGSLYFIPFVGGVINAVLGPGVSNIVLGTLMSSLQIVGFIMLIGGAVGRREVPVRGPPRIVPGPGQAGLGLEWVW